MALLCSSFSLISGFSLIEVTVASGILAGALVTLAQLFATSVATNRAAQASTYTAILAAQKMEQLRALSWGFDNTGVPVTDVSTDASAVVDGASGGTGLLPSPADAMTKNVPGWVDYADQFGNALGTGPMPPPSTVYIRRWAIEPLPNDAANTLIFHVLVTTALNRGNADRAGSTERLTGESRIVTVKTRKAQ